MPLDFTLTLTATMDGAPVGSSIIEEISLDQALSEPGQDGLGSILSSMIRCASLDEDIYQAAQRSITYGDDS